MCILDIKKKQNFRKPSIAAKSSAKKEAVIVKEISVTKAQTPVLYGTERTKQMP